MQQPDVRPSHQPAPPPRPPFGAECDAPDRGVSRPHTTIRLSVDGADALMLCATAVLVVAGAFLESGTGSAGVWLALSGIALAVVLVARAVRGSAVRRTERERSGERRARSA
jgi:hypothetical protein